MLCNFHAACCRNQCGCGGNVKAVCIVPAGSYDLEQLHICLHFCRVIAHRCRTACDLVRGLCPCALGGKRCQKCRILRRCCLTVHNLVHNRISLIIGEILFVYNFYNRLFDHRLSLLYMNKIFKHFLSIRCQNGFRVELHPVNGISLMLHCHDLTVRRYRCNL